MYLFALLSFLGLSVVYALVTFLLSCLVSGCAVLNEVQNLTHYDVKQPKAIVETVTPSNHGDHPENAFVFKPSLDEADVADKKIQQIITKPVKNYSNSLEQVLKTQDVKKLSPQWQNLGRQFRNLAPYHRNEIVKFYSNKNFNPVWYDINGDLLQYARNSYNDINEEIYLTSPLPENYLSPPPKALTEEDLAEDDRLQKDFAFTLSLVPALEKIRNGLTSISGAGTSQNNSYKSFALEKVLNGFVNGYSANEIAKLTDFHPQYKSLKQAVVDLYSIRNAGGYVHVPRTRTLKFGTKGNDVIALRRRLAQSGINAAPLNSPTFDNALIVAVKQFQESRGIVPDGVVGAQVFNALNRTVSDDLKLLLVNIERIRRSPDVTNMGKSVNVNVPEMFLRVKQNNQEILGMRTIVGRTDRKTPIFNDKIEYIDFNPYWNVPYSIAVKDILPKLKRNPSYIAQNDMQLLSGGKVINPKGINWHKYTEKNFPYSLRQNPGNKNALGTVKFMFPNQYAVYLHDTPARGKFNTIVRSESSGCVRVAKPRELAEILLRGRKSPAEINQTFMSNKNRVISLRNAVPVNIEYLTAFVRDGIINIRPDIYNYDPVMINALTRFRDQKALVTIDLSYPEKG